MSDLYVGQELWFVGSQRCYRNCTLTIAKIGKKWVTFEGRYHFKMHKETMRIDGGQHSSPGMCYFSKEEHDAHLIKQAIWRAIHQRLPYSVPSHVTVEQIHEVARIFGLDIKLDSRAANVA